MSTITSVFYTVAQDPPEYPPQKYRAGKYSYPLTAGDLISEQKPDSGFYGYSTCTQGEPVWGYPFHSGLIEGINDTCQINFRFVNKTANPRDITSDSPETWVMPVIYHNYVDARNKQWAVDTSDFSYSFSHWSQGAGEFPIVKPDSIKYNIYFMVFDMWDIPVGTKVAGMVSTDNAPTGFSIIRPGMGQYWYTEAKDVKDTINGYVRLCWRSLDRSDSVTALTWTDSILAKNDSSLSGWMCRGFVYERMQDTTNVISSYGYVMSIFQNNNDPLIDFSDTTLTGHERNWATDIFYLARIRKWVFETGKPFFTM